MTSFIFEIQHVSEANTTVFFAVKAHTEEGAIRLARMLNPDAKLITGAANYVGEIKIDRY